MKYRMGLAMIIGLAVMGCGEGRNPLHTIERVDSEAIVEFSECFQGIDANENQYIAKFDRQCIDELLLDEDDEETEVPPPPPPARRPVVDNVDEEVQVPDATDTDTDADRAAGVPVVTEVPEVKGPNNFRTSWPTWSGERPLDKRGKPRDYTSMTVQGFWMVELEWDLGETVLLYGKCVEKGVGQVSAGDMEVGDAVPPVILVGDTEGIALGSEYIFMIVVARQEDRWFGELVDFELID